MSVVVATGPGIPGRRFGVRALVLAILVTVFALFGSAARADGDPADDVIRSLSVEITLAQDGTMTVRETYEWDFGARNGLGFYRVLISGQGYDPDPSMMRVYEYSDYAVSSPSGAPAEVWVERERGSEIHLAVGAPDGSSDTRSGLQTYVLTYKVKGTLNAIRGEANVPDQDELFWNIFTDFDNPIENISVTVTGPGPVTNQTCFQGPRFSTDPCASAVPAGDSVTFTGANASAGDSFTVVAAWAPRTFSDTTPILEAIPEGGSIGGGDGRFAALWSFVDSNAPWLTGGLLGIAALLAGFRVSQGRDHMYEGLPPGTRYADAVVGARAVPMRGESAVAVRLTPPEGIRPAQASVIMREATSPDAMSATLIDLAVRGYLTIQVEGTGVISRKPNNWRLTRASRPGPSDLLPYESELLYGLFSRVSSVTTSSLSGNFTGEVADFRRELTQDSDRNGWFRRRGLTAHQTGRKKFNPYSLMVVAFVLVVFFMIGRSAFGVLDAAGRLPAIWERLPWPTIGVIAALLAIPIALRATAKAAHGRSAEGRAIYDQLRGFKQYIATADAERLRFDVGEDVFSRYLPWAMIFGEADRWGRAFSQLAAQGRYEAVPAWYGADDSRSGDPYTSLTDSVSEFSRSGMSSLSYSPSTSGSSGGSGFSGGGGGGAGGGGGGGGGGGR